MQISPNAPTVKLGLIRFALLAGALGFGAVVYFAQPIEGRGQRPTAETIQQLRYVGYAVWGVAIAGMLFLKIRLGETIESGSPNLMIIGWALAEMTALFGGVYYQLVGDYALYVAGIVVMLVSFALFPVPRDR